jgi:hypothetical protein
MTDEFKDKIEAKKRRQHEAWLRWYKSPKGEAYRVKRKLKQNDTTSQSPEQQ